MNNGATAKVVGIIPSRYGSTRFPGKPLASIAGKPLIQLTYENAKQCRILDDLIVATDDQRIMDVVLGFGGKAMMTSPNHINGTERLAEVVTNYPHADIVINIQGDEPCLEPEVIESVVKALIDDPKSVMSTAVIPIKNIEEARDPSIVKCVMDIRGHALYFSRSMIPYDRNKGVHFYRHLGIYGYRREFLLHYNELSVTPLQHIEDLEQLKVLEHGFKIKTAIVDSLSIGVDTPEDIKKVEKLLCNRNTSL